jgi:hypothetical protein
LLLFVLVAVGIQISMRIPIANDEYYSINSSVSHTTYGAMWAGKIGEGGNAPLFYFLEKLQFNAFGYQPPVAWSEDVYSPKDKIFIRFQSVLYVSLSLCALFWYFARRYSLLMGFYSVAVAVSSFIILSHWAEARPYPLWFALSMAQSLLLLEILNPQNIKRQKLWGWLILVNILLAVTTSLSMVQITASAIILWLAGERNVLRHLQIFLLPLTICLFYYFRSPKYDFFFVDGPLALINANIPKDRLVIIGLFTGVFLYMNGSISAFLKKYEGRFLIFTALMLFFFSLVLFKLKLHSVAQQGFQLSSRYFIALAPVGIVGVTLFSFYLVNAFKSKAARIGMALLLLAFLAFRFYKTIQFVHPKFFTLFNLF